MRNVFVLLGSMLVLLCSCGNNKNDVQADLSALYFDYQVTGEEGNDKLAVKAEFRTGSREGEAISITDSGRIALDNREMMEDSTKRTGFFYETYELINGFEGPHELRFTWNNNVFTEKFNFEPLVLLTAIPDSVRKEDLALEFNGIGEGDEIQVVLSDTSSAGDGVTFTDASGSGRIWLRAVDLAGLAPGPVLLEIIRESSRDLEEATIAGGRLQITYTIRRQFNLVN